MRFWSEGLGDRQLVMNLSKAKIKRTDEIIMLNGVVDSPAPWEYEVKINQNDWVKILETAVTPEACGFIANQATLLQAARLFRRKDAIFGVVGGGELGQAVQIAKLDPDIVLMLGSKHTPLY